MAKDSPRLPPRWFIRAAWIVHRALYSISGGRFGLRRPTAERYGMLRITTIGRRTGEKRKAILGYFEDGPNLFTLAMNGWGEGAPAWWLNLQAHPEARVELATTLVALGRAAVAEREAGAALECLLELGAVVEAGRARRILDASARDSLGRPPLPEVTPREREVLRLLTDGLTNQQIAGRLVLSQHTVHRHVTNILRKLDLPSRTAAAVLAVRSGLLDTTRK